MKFKFFKTPRVFSWIFPSRTWGFSRQVDTVYLTFDDGPQPEVTDWVLSFLKTKSIKATFFCVGNNLQKYPHIKDKIIMDGHVIGNHTMNHENSLKVGFQDFYKSIHRTSFLNDSKLFRPPYGRLNEVNARKLSKKFHIIMWTWLSYDFDQNIPIYTIVNKAEKQIKAGDILVFHDNIKSFERLKDLLPKVVQIIENKGLNFSVIDENTALKFKK